MIYGDEVKIFYSRKKQYNGFKDINSLEKMDMLNNKISFVSRILEEDSLTSINSIHGSVGSRYIKLLYMMRYQNGLTFDDKLYIVINIMDPNLEILKNFRMSNIISKTQIDLCIDEDKKKSLIESKKIQESYFGEQMRMLLGFYTPELVRFESDYQRKFVKNTNTLLEPRLYDDKNLNYDFDQETKDRLDLIIQEFRENHKVPNFKLVENTVVYNKSSLNLKNNSEAAYFLIYLFDPELKSAVIREMESNWNKMKPRIIEEIGFYSKEFVDLVYKHAIKIGYEMDPYQYVYK